MTQAHILPFLGIAMLAAACGGSSGDTAASSGTGTTHSTTGSGGSAGSATSTGQGGETAMEPKVIFVAPVDAAIDVPTNANIAATFNQAMDCASLDATTFTLTSTATSIPVLGTVICGDSTAVFWPAAHLASNAAFTATITTGAKSLGGKSLAADYVWSFDTGAVVGVGQPVSLGKAGSYAILSKSAISTVPTSMITGDIGVSPVTAAAITGFSLTADPTNVFSTSVQVTGKVFGANYAVPTPGNLTTAVSDMELAFTDAAARAPDSTELGAGNIGGLTLAPGVYRWSSGLLIPTDVTLSGNENDVWIFQIAQGLLVSSATSVKLTGGAKSKNVFWGVTGPVEVGTTAHFAGIVLSKTAITLKTGASFDGRMLAQTAVSLDSNAVVQPAP